VQRLTKEFLSDPIRVTIGSEKLTANKDVKQIVKIVKDKYDKDEHLNGILRQYAEDKMLIFANTKRMCGDLAWELEGMGHSARAIHGDLNQSKRERVLEKFRKGSVQIMVATDVASRGLDIPNVSVVVNYDFPIGRGGVEDYIHRIGRTGRAGSKGVSVTYFTRNDAKSARELVRILKDADEEVPKDLQNMVTGGRYGGGNRFGRERSRNKWY